MYSDQNMFSRTISNEIYECPLTFKFKDAGPGFGLPRKDLKYRFTGQFFRRSPINHFKFLSDFVTFLFFAKNVSQIKNVHSNT